MNFPNFPEKEGEKEQLKNTVGEHENSRKFLCANFF